MAFTFGFFYDSALTTQSAPGAELLAAQDSDLSLPPTDSTVYFGSPATAGTVKAVDAINPGVAPIVMSVADALPSSGAPASEIKLALSFIGLDTAVAGASLELGTQVLSGAANKITIYVRRTSAVAAVGTYTDITCKTQELAEAAV